MDEQEEKARQDLSTADEVLKEASANVEKVGETKQMGINSSTEDDRYCKGHER